MLTTNLSDIELLIIVVIILALLFIFGKCTFRCGGFKMEGFQDSTQQETLKNCLGNCLTYHRGSGAKKCAQGCLNKTKNCIDSCTTYHEGHKAVECADRCIR